MEEIKSLSLDLETYSDVDLGKCGVYRYAESPRFYKCLNKSTQKCAYKNPHLPRKTDSFLIQSSS